MFVIVILLSTTALVSGHTDRNIRVSAQVKDQILSLIDADSAYELYMQSYQFQTKNGIGPAMLRARVDPDTQRREEDRKKSNFVKYLTKAKTHNAKFQRGESRFKMTVNTFSVMDEQEKKAYLGVVNATKHNTKTGTSRRLLSSKEHDHPETLSWNSMGYVTNTFDQGTCGSCWTFPAVALLEFALKHATGKLIQLSNQQLLDCTYENLRGYERHDGCEGGLYEHAWDLIKRTQHLAPLAKYQYRETDYRCDYERYSNALEGNVKLTGYRAVAPTADGVLSAVQLMPLAVAMFVEDDLYGYGGGMYDGCHEEHEDPDHAVLLTGYGSNYWEIRNSWGPDWGLNGFFKFYRGSGAQMCFLLDYAAYITYDNLKDGSGGDPDPTEAATTSTTSNPTTQSEGSSTEEPTEPPTPESTDESKPETTTEEAGSSTTSAVETEPLTTENAVTTATEALVTEPKVECEPGQYWTGEKCLLCEVNTYSSHGAVFCVSCPEGTTSKEGSDSADDCVEERCTDSYGDCGYWAEQGHCDNGEYISFMENDCRRSCNFCEGYCEAGYYRDNESGYCTICPENTFSAYKSSSCQECPAGSTSPEGSTDISNCVRVEACEDTASDQWCMTYVPYGYCKSRENVMQRKCAKSCGFCQDETANTCKDKYEFDVCQKLRDRGYCYEPGFLDLMRNFCGRTCGTCREPEENALTCEDDVKYAGDCPKWASQGYCEYGSKYTMFMHQSCKLSCYRIAYIGVCKEKTQEPTTTPAPTTTQPTEPVYSTTSFTSDTTDCWVVNTGISDNVILAQPEFTNYETCEEKCKALPNCRGIMVSPAYWAYRECFVLGEERMGDRFGWTAAKRECFQPGFTEDEGEEECEDSVQYREDCPGWAEEYCTEGSYVEFMQEHCRDSCGFCRVSVCQDVAEHAGSCRKWRKAGYCTAASYTEWMRENCAGTCGTCAEARDHVTDTCVDHVEHEEDCGYWAEQGFCKTGQYVQFMREKCAKSCNTCRGRGKGRGRGKHRG